MRWLLLARILGPPVDFFDWLIFELYSIVNTVDVRWTELPIQSPRLAAREPHYQPGVPRLRPSQAQPGRWRLKRKSRGARRRTGSRWRGPSLHRFHGLRVDFVPTAPSRRSASQASLGLPSASLRRSASFPLQPRVRLRLLRVGRLHGRVPRHHTGHYRAARHHTSHEAIDDDGSAGSSDSQALRHHSGDPVTDHAGTWVIGGQVRDFRCLHDAQRHGHLDPRVSTRQTSVWICALRSGKLGLDQGWTTPRHPGGRSRQPVGK